MKKSQNDFCLTRNESISGMKILFFRLGAIGDVLMTTPLVRQVRKNFPGAKIDYLVGNWSVPVLKNNKNIDEIISFDDEIIIKKKPFQLIRLIKKIRKRNYDLIFVLNKHWLFNLTAFLFGIKKRFGFDRRGEGIFLTEKVSYDAIRHEIYYYLDLAKKARLKVNYKDSYMDLPLNKKDEKFAEVVFNKYRLNRKQVIGIAPAGCYNPASCHKEKQWPIENYRALAKKLTERGFSIMLFGGKKDLYAENEFEKPNNRKVISLIGKTTLQGAASLISHCNYFICNDTGLMHIAASANKKVISIFGPTNPKRFAPLQKESKAIWKDCKIYDFKSDLYGKKQDEIFMEKLSVDDILKEIK